MKNLFLYGTLRYIPLLEIVIGRPLDDLQISQDLLLDHAAMAVA